MIINEYNTTAGSTIVMNYNAVAYATIFVY